MTAKINTRYVEGVTVMEINGRITLGDGAVVLRDAIHQALKFGTQKLVLDLGGVAYMDSAGLGELTSAYTSATNKNCDIRLDRLTTKLDELMQITKLATVFDVYPDEKEALASFSGFQHATV